MAFVDRSNFFRQNQNSHFSKVTAGRNAAARQRLASPECLVLFLERQEVKDDWRCDRLRCSGGLVAKWQTLNVTVAFHISLSVADSQRKVV